MKKNNQTMKFPYINHQIELVIEDKVYKYLKEMTRENLFESLNYIVKEVAGNANKANMKRIHFRRKDLNIHDHKEYEEGMKNFQEELNEKPDVYFQLARELGFYVKISMYIEEENMVIMVLDNSPLLPVEVDRIREKFKKAAKFKTLEQVFAEGLDLSEGGGFGLIMTILMLRKIGVDEKVFKIMKNEKFTAIHLQLPLNLVSSQESEVIAESIATEIDAIPQFPPHILQLQKILGDPNAEFKDLAKIIERDPALIADLLKTANSVLYALPHQVESIEEAVKLIGFKGVGTLILTYSTQHLMMNRYRLDVINEIMNHSAEVAFYAHEIARHFNLKEHIDTIYLGGILHDIGKIMINALKPHMMKRIKKLCKEKGLSQNFLEQLTNGYNHAIIGGKLAEKWNFPQLLTELIRYHHVPTESQDENFPMVSCIYLADFFYYHRRGDASYTDINYLVRQFFEITNNESFEKLFKKVEDSFLKKMSRWQRV